MSVTQVDEETDRESISLETREWGDKYVMYEKDDPTGSYIIAEDSDTVVPIEDMR